MPLPKKIKPVMTLLAITFGVISAGLISPSWSSNLNGQELKPRGNAQPETTETTSTADPVELSALNGTWKPINISFGGRTMPKEQAEAIELKIQDGSFESKAQGTSESGKITLVETEGENLPQAMDIKISSGPNADKVMMCIFKIEEDNMTVCYSLKENRPTEFVSNSDNMFLLIEYEKSDQE